VLVIQQAGILGVPPISLTLAPATYKWIFLAEPLLARDRPVYVCGLALRLGTGSREADSERVWQRDETTMKRGWLRVSSRALAARGVSRIERNRKRGISRLQPDFAEFLTCTTGC
jgi:hypothetical protein